MVKNSNKFIELDADILSMPFKIETNWHVLTDAACTGKTTLIDMLAQEGYQILPESARLFFEQETTKGRSLEDIREDGGSLQRGIADMQLKFESACETSRITFLDRALPDSLPFYRVSGLNPNEILPKCFFHHYANVFILERLPLYRNQTLGPEDDETSEFLNEWLYRDYKALGYSVIKVPVLPPRERLAFILERLPGARGM
jgi:predicted ATPase